MKAGAWSFYFPKYRPRASHWRLEITKTSMGVVFWECWVTFLCFSGRALVLWCWHVEPAVNRQPWLPPGKLVEHSLLPSTWFLARSCAPCTRTRAPRTTHPRTRAPMQPRTPRSRAAPHPLTHAPTHPRAPLTRARTHPRTREPANPRTRAPAHQHPRFPAHAHPR